MSSVLPQYYEDTRDDEGEVYKLVCLAAGTRPRAVLFVLASLTGGLNIAVPSADIGEGAEFNPVPKPKG